MGHEAENLRTNEPDKTWRSDGLHALESILFDHNAARPVDAVALINCNFQSTATLTLRRGSTTSTVDITETLTPGTTDIFKLITPGTYRYSKIEIADGANPDGYLECGVAWLGQRTRYDAGFKSDFSFPEREVNAVHAMEYGTRHVEALYSQISMDLEWEGLDDWEVGFLNKMWSELKGQAVPLFFIPDRTIVEGYWVRMVDFKRTRGISDYVGISLEELSRG